MIRKADEIRPYVERFEKVLFRNRPETAARIKALYPPREDFEALLQTDAARHIESATRTGAPVVEDEETGEVKLVDSQPVVRLAIQFQNGLDLKLAAAEAGVEREPFLQTLESSRPLAEALGPLALRGKTVKRDTYVEIFPQLAVALRLGKYVPPENGRELFHQNHRSCSRTRSG